MIGGPTLGLDGRIVLVTGAARGIGAAVAVAMAGAGATLVLCDRLDADLRVVTETIRQSGGEVSAHVLDVRDAGVVDDMFEHVRRAFGRVDVLVNNAGGTFATPFVDMSENGEAAVIATNFTSVASFIRRSIPLMKEHGGSIVNVTSIEAHRAAPGVAVYAAMKAGLASLTKSLALELAPARIRINCVAPDMIDTEGSLVIEAAMRSCPDDTWFRQPWPTDGSVGDAADAVIFLASSLARFVTGTTLHVDGGNLAAGGWKLLKGGHYVV